MKLYLNLSKRSNPDLNIKEYPIEILFQYCQDPSYYLTFTSINKLGINPHSTYKTPLGIYCYRLFDYKSKIVKKYQEFSTYKKQLKTAVGKEKDNLLMTMSRGFRSLEKIFPFATTQNYFQIFQYTGKALLNLSSYGEENLTKDIAFLEGKYGKLRSTTKPLVNTPGGEFWNYTYFLAQKLSEKFPVTWNRLFQEVGYAGVVDSGEGIIHINEPAQAVFFVNQKLQLVKTYQQNLGFPIDTSLELHNITEKTEFEQIEILEKNPLAIKWIRNPSEILQLAAVKVDPFAIKQIKNPTENTQLAVVSAKGPLIRLIQNPSERVMVAAVNAAPSAIQYIENPTELVQITAVNKDIISLALIKNPTEKIQLFAINKDSNSIQYIKNPSEEVQLAAVTQNPYALANIKVAVSLKVQLASVQKFPQAIQWIRNPSEKMQLLAVKLDGSVIQYIETPSSAVQIAAINSSNTAIHVLVNYCHILPSKKVQLAVVEHDPRCYFNLLAYLPSPPPEEVLIAALKKEPVLIKRIKNPSEKVQLAVIQTDPSFITYIKKPAPSVLEYLKTKK